MRKAATKPPKLPPKAAPLEEGCVGAGAGATVGTMLTSQGIHGMKGGVGTASVKVGDVVVGALAIANTAGDIVDWRNGSIVAGARRADSKGFVGITQAVLKNPPKLVRTLGERHRRSGVSIGSRRRGRDQCAI